MEVRGRRTDDTHDVALPGLLGVVEDCTGFGLNHRAGVGANLLERATEMCVFFCGYVLGKPQDGVRDQVVERSED